MLTKLRKLRKMNEITLDDISKEIGISVGYLNRIERGYIEDIKNPEKKKKLETYIVNLEKTTRETFTF